MSSQKTAPWRSLLPVALCLCVLCLPAVTAAPKKPPRAASVEALFSPGDGLEDRIVEEIGRARKRVRIQMYFFTSKPIADALVSAKGRGVDVTILLDKSQEKMTYGRAPLLRRSGVKVLYDRDHEVANNKIILIDDSTVITGSYNLTRAAEEKNAENIVIIKNDADVVGRFDDNFETHLAHSHKSAK